MTDMKGDISKSPDVCSKECCPVASKKMDALSTVTKTVPNPQPCNTEIRTSDRHFDWNRILDELKQCCTYEEIVAIVRRYKLPPLELRRKYRQTLCEQIDTIAMKFFPADHPKNFVPIITKGNGDCFAHALLHALFGTQDRHVKIRVCLVFEAMLNEDLHLSNEYLSYGCVERLPARPNLRPPSTTIASRYCMYSGDDSLSGLRLTAAKIKAVYRREVLHISKPGRYTGIWQFHHATELSQIPVCTVFPDRNVNTNI